MWIRKKQFKGVTLNSVIQFRDFVFIPIIMLRKTMKQKSPSSTLAWEMHRGFTVHGPFGLGDGWVFICYQIGGGVLSMQNFLWR